jgi:hypothetical protein
MTDDATAGERAAARGEELLVSPSGRGALRSGYDEQLV